MPARLPVPSISEVQVDFCHMADTGGPRRIEGDPDKLQLSTLKIAVRVTRHIISPNDKRLLIFVNLSGASQGSQLARRFSEGLVGPAKSAQF